MIHMRIHLSNTFATALAHAVTIAMRYSAVRFQGLNPQGSVVDTHRRAEKDETSFRSETRVLDYPLQQEKLIPCLASAYAFLSAFFQLDSYFAELKVNQTLLFQQLPEVSDAR